MGSRLGSWNLHYACETRGCGDHEAFFAHTLEMKLDGLLNQAFYFLARISNRDNTRKVWNVGAPVSRSFLVDDRVFHESSSFRSNPALRRIAFKVPTGTSLPAWPGTVTTCPCAGAGTAGDFLGSS